MTADQVRALIAELGSWEGDTRPVTRGELWRLLSALAGALEGAGGPQGVRDGVGAPAVHRGGPVAPEAVSAARTGHVGPPRLPVAAPESPSPTGPGARLTVPRPGSGQRDSGATRGAQTGAEGREAAEEANP